MNALRRFPSALAVAALLLSGCAGRPADGDAARVTTGSARPDQEAASGPASRPAAPDDPHRIPDDFPLAAGMAADGELADLMSGDGTGLRHLWLCDERPLRRLTARDRIWADNSGGESMDTRELLRLRSAEEASSIAEDLTELARSCPEEVREGTRITTEVHPSPFAGPPAVAVVRSFTVLSGPSSGLAGRFVHHVLPRGDLLLITSTYADWTDPATGIAETAKPLAATAGALSALPQQDSPTPSASVAATTAAPLPAGLDLMVGMPEDGRDHEVVPQTPDGEGVPRVVVCDEQVWHTWHAGEVRRLVTTASGPEHFEAREVVALGDPAVAEGVLAVFREAVRGCGTWGNQVWALLPPRAGAVTAGLTYTDGLGSSVFQMTRRDDVVVLVTTYGEGSVDSLPRQAAGVTRDASAITRQLCALGRVSC